jgi:diguanylate cyclase (GGDEF)-like protein/PAS domain S-box-containing protein
MKNERILIVEDEKIIALDLQRRLEKFGYLVVDLVASGGEAILKAEEHVPDIILMDIMLSGEIDGISAAIEIKKRLRIPIIFLTAYADERTLERAKEAEPFGYIIKPFKERELYTTIDIAIYKNKMDQKLLKQERLFSAILNSVGDGIISTNRDGKIQFLNPVAEVLTGWDEIEVKGKSLEEIFVLQDEKTSAEIKIKELLEGSGNSPLFFDRAFLMNKFEARILIEGIISPISIHKESIDGQTITFRDITDIQKMSDTITYQASHDQLTGTVNREKFVSMMKTEIEDALKHEISHSFVYIDIDQFKFINNLAGHFAGDELLRQVTKDLIETLTDEHIVGRLGGDEFGILLKCPLSEGIGITLNLIKSLKRRFIWQNNFFNVTMSAGIVPINKENQDVYHILSAADSACSLAKEEGGDRLKIFESTDSKFLKTRGEMQWISRLTGALENNHFYLVGQKIKSLNIEKVELEKYEILLRLREEDGSTTPPLDFIRAAERYSLMPAIDKWVINEVVDFESKRSQVINTDIQYSYCVNISAASMTEDSFLTFIIDKLRDTGVDPKRFCFELTETTAVENLSTATGFIQTLQEIGCTFALDDFGNGFTSFSYLKNLPVDYLKIDGSYVKDIVNDPINLGMVEAINKIGHVMGMQTIAEYVENAEIEEELKKIGVDFAQGYGIAKPAPLEEIL